VIAVDTNILIYAHRADSDWHEPAAERLTALAEGRSPWAIPWPCIHEFYSIATHTRVFVPPSPASTALDQLVAWMESPSLVLLSEGPGYWETVSKLIASARIVGPAIHDARIAALCLHHGVRELWTADRDFSRYPGLLARNPLVE